jgi:hypothetical protein
MKSNLFVRQFLNSRLIDHPSEFSWTFLIWPSLPLTLNHSEVIFLLHGKPAAKLCLIWLFNICYMLVWCGGWGVGSTKKNLTDAMAYTISYIYCNVEFWIVTIHNMIILSKVLYCFNISHCYISICLLRVVARCDAQLIQLVCIGLSYIMLLIILFPLFLIEGDVGETGSCVNRVVSVRCAVWPANWHLSALFSIK